MNEEKRQTRNGLFLTFFTIFISNAFVLTVSFFLFFHYIELDPKQIPLASLLTFGNVFLVSFLFVAVHMIYNHFTVTRPVKKIKKALDQITNGDLSIRIEPCGNAAFDAIIESINHMTAELSSVETLKTDFISNVSHEIKTPIAIMQNYATLLQSHDLKDDERIEYAKTLSNAASRLNSLITNILKLNRLENQQIKPNLGQFDLSGQLTECLLGFEQIWEEKNIEIIPEIEDNITITSDPELLSIVFNNLLSNAFKFTEPNGTVYITLKQTDDHVSISIKDTGCGISSETGKHIFDKFYQGDTSHATQGNGLGLALVKRIIDIVNGEITVQSTPGHGSTFTIVLERQS